MRRIKGRTERRMRKRTEQRIEKGHEKNRVWKMKTKVRISTDCVNMEHALSYKQNNTRQRNDSNICSSSSRSAASLCRWILTKDLITPELHLSSHYHPVVSPHTLIHWTTIRGREAARWLRTGLRTILPSMLSAGFDFRIKTRENVCIYWRMLYKERGK